VQVLVLVRCFPSNRGFYMCNADVNALPGWLGKKFYAKGGRPLPCFGPW
jgi:hypothetical protein